jgi:lactoylglutathione lyase
MTVSLKRVDVAVLFVADIERTKAFYREKFDLRAAEDDEDGAYFQLEGASLMLLSKPGAQDLLSNDAVAVDSSLGASSQLVAFVDDVDAAYSDLAARGVEFVREPTDREWGLRTAHFKDPDGHIWELAQPLAQK